MKNQLACLAMSVCFAMTAAQSVSAADSPRVKIDTSMGEIVVELNAEKAPGTVENFLKYVEKKSYDGTIFHRVKKDFMIQGGGFDVKMKEREKFAPIRNEATNGLKNAEYTIAMARTSDPHSATNQFFINSSPEASFLDARPAEGNAGYAVFGKVIEGQKVVDKIESVKTKAIPNPRATYTLMRDVPAEPVVIKSIRLIDAKK